MPALETIMIATLLSTLPTTKIGRKLRTSKLLIAAALLSLAALPFLARPVSADPTGTTGQPNQTCQSAFPSGPLTPQGFNTAGFANADQQYAGNGQNTQT